jgi:hypothetical protein
MIDWTTKFSGLVIKIYYKVGVKKGNTDVPKKNVSPFELIPSYTGTPISMKFEEGETHKY